MTVLKIMPNGLIHPQSYEETAEHYLDRDGPVHALPLYRATASRYADIGDELNAARCREIAADLAAQIETADLNTSNGAA